MTIEFEPGQRQRIQKIVDHWNAEMFDVHETGPDAMAAVIRKR